MKISLTSESDGIEGEALRRPPSPADPSTFKYQRPKRGRPRKPRDPEVEDDSGPPTLVPRPANVLDEISNFHEHAQQMSGSYSITYQEEPRDPFDEFLSNPVAVETFKMHLDCLMKGYDFPKECEMQGIDPYIAMMLCRKNDPNYASINFDGMLQLYAKMKNYEWSRNQEDLNTNPQSSPTLRSTSIYQALPQRPATPPNIDLRPAETIESIFESVDPKPQPSKKTNRTYTELQTVAVNSASNADEVLRRHQKEPEQQVNSNEESTQKDQQQSEEEERQKQPQGGSGRPVIKQEILMPPSVPEIDDNLGSVQCSSVYPCPPSVTEVTGPAGRLPVGKGQKVVAFSYENTYVGPMLVETEKEVCAVVDLVYEKANEFKAKRERSKLPLTNRNIQKLNFYSSKAVEARSILAKEVIQCIDHAFTMRGMRENVIGRKTNYYPKRSKVIKLDSEGIIIWPPDHPDFGKKHHSSLPREIKPEPKDQVVSVKDMDFSLIGSPYSRRREPGEVRKRRPGRPRASDRGRTLAHAVSPRKRFEETPGYSRTNRQFEDRQDSEEFCQ